MSATTTPPAAVSHSAASNAAARRDQDPRPRGRAVIGAVIVIAFLASVLLQRVAFSYRQSAINRNRPDGAVPSRMANLDSFSLALLLGGLRGPLVMFLWTNSETQKGEKDLQSFDTQVELIRLLQPEFDSVHLFQIWNKAYNISVQMASLANKYAAILDALAYARNVDLANPNNINILAATGGLYAEKLGNSAEKAYYVPRVRDETLPVYKVALSAAEVAPFRKAVADAGVDDTRVRVTANPDGSATATIEKVAGDRVLAAFKGSGLNVSTVTRQSLRPQSSGGRRYEMDTLLDEKGYILPQYLKPAVPALAGRNDRNDGSELQHLAPFQPFPYGLPPQALGYNYNKRAQILQRVNGQKHLQSSDLVIDNQPGYNLKTWSEEEWDRGRRLEQRAFNLTGEGVDNLTREARTAKLPVDAKVADRAALDEAIFSYERAAKAAQAALPEFAELMLRYSGSLQNYRGQSQNLRGVVHLNLADAKYLRAIAAAPGQRAAMLAEAKAEYQQAKREYLTLVLSFYVEEPDARAAGYSRADALADRPLPALEELYNKTLALMEKRYAGSSVPNVSDLEEYAQNVGRIHQRLELIK